jgi:DNA end-binding protein Ku
VGADDKTAKPFTLFVAALEAAKQHAIAKLAMHNREHIVLIRPSEFGLMLHTLFYPKELHAANRGSSGGSKYSAKELELAKTLVTHLKAPFKPAQYKDTYRTNVERLIAEKRKGKEITVVEQKREKPVTDILEALKQSLKASGRRRAA